MGKANVTALKVRCLFQSQSLRLSDIAHKLSNITSDDEHVSLPHLGRLRPTISSAFFPALELYSQASRWQYTSVTGLSVNIFDSFWTLENKYQSKQLMRAANSSNSISQMSLHAFSTGMILWGQTSCLLSFSCPTAESSWWEETRCRCLLLTEWSHVQSHTLVFTHVPRLMLLRLCRVSTFR